jgi:hypothetical protein
MPRWAAIITGTAIITAITGTTANGFPRPPPDHIAPLRPWNQAGLYRCFPKVQAGTVSGGASITRMRIPFYAPTV